MVHDFAKDSLSYGVGNGVNSAIRLMLIPIYIRGLSVEEFGVFGLLETIINTSIWIASLGMHAALVRFGEKNERNAQQYTTTGFVVTVLLGATSLLLLLAVWKTSFVKTLFHETEYFYVFRLSVFLLPAMMIKRSAEGTWRIRGKSVWLSSYRVGVTLLELGAAFVLVALLHRGLVGLLWARLIAFWAAAAVGAGCFLSRFRFSDFRADLLPAMLRYGLPLIPYKIALEVNNGAARFILRYFLGLHAVGIYTLAYKVGSTASSLVTAIADSYEAFVYNNARTANGEEKVHKASVLFIAGVIVTGIVVYFIAPVLVHVFDNEGIYSDSIALVGLVVIAMIFNGYYRVASFGIFLAKKTYLLPMITSTMAGGNVLLCFVLIPFLGVRGAVIAAASSEVGRFLVSYWQTSRLYPIRLWKAFLVGGIVILAVLVDMVVH